MARCRESECLFPLRSCACSVWSGQGNRACRRDDKTKWESLWTPWWAAKNYACIIWTTSPFSIRSFPKHLNLLMLTSPLFFSGTWTASLWITSSSRGTRRLRRSLAARPTCRPGSISKASKAVWVSEKPYKEVMSGTPSRAWMIWTLRCVFVCASSTPSRVTVAFSLPLWGNVNYRHVSSKGLNLFMHHSQTRRVGDETLNTKTSVFNMILLSFRIWIEQKWISWY